MEKVWQWLHSKDIYTWIGHGVLGFILAALFGWQFVLGAFVYREASDLINWWADPEPVTLPGMSYGKRPFMDKLKDGFFDLWAPMAGAALAMILFR